MLDETTQTPMEYRPICTVDGVVLTIEDNRLKVMLHRRARAPFAGAWALPGGYIHADEDAGSLEAIQRILRDKTGLPTFYLEQLQTYTGPDRDPRGWSVSIAHLALVPRGALPGAGEDIMFADVDDLPEIAFDHVRMISDAVSRLRIKGAYSSLPAALLPEMFTLSELHGVYEIVVGHRLDAASLRRKLIDNEIVEDTGDTTKASSRRPAALYRVSDTMRTFDRRLGA